MDILNIVDYITSQVEPGSLGKYIKDFVHDQKSYFENILRKKTVESTFDLFSILSLYLYYKDKAHIFLFPAVKDNKPYVKFGILFEKRQVKDVFNEFNIKLEDYLNFLKYSKCDKKLKYLMYKNILHNIEKVKNIFEDKEYIFIFPTKQIVIGRSFELSLFCCMFLEKDIVNYLLTGKVDNFLFIDKVDFIDIKSTLEKLFKFYLHSQNINHIFEVLHILNSENDLLYLYIRNNEDLAEVKKSFFKFLIAYFKQTFNKYKIKNFQKIIDKLNNYYQNNFEKAYKRLEKNKNFKGIFYFPYINFSNEDEIKKILQSIKKYFFLDLKSENIHIAYKGPITFTPFISLCLYKLLKKKNLNLIFYHYSSSKYYPSSKIEARNLFLQGDKSNQIIYKSVENKCNEKQVCSLVIYLNVNNYPINSSFQKELEKISNIESLDILKIDINSNPFDNNLKLNTYLVKKVERDILDKILEKNYKSVYFDVISPLIFSILLFFFIFKFLDNLKKNNLSIYIFDNINGKFVRISNI